MKAELNQLEVQLQVHKVSERRAVNLSASVTPVALRQMEAQGFARCVSCGTQTMLALRRGGDPSSPAPLHH